MTEMWMIRAGRNQVNLDCFLDDGCVFIGMSPAVGEEALRMDRVSLVEHTQALNPDWSKHKTASQAGQLFRYLQEVQVAEQVVTFDPSQRRYIVGTITGAPVFVAEYRFERPVEWTHRVPREALGVATTNSLGSIMTIFRPSNEAAADLRNNAVPLDAPEGEQLSLSLVPVVADEEVADILQENLLRSRDLIEDRIAALDPYELQDLVAGVLRAMGYKTRVSPRGADRGVDVFASPDGLGLQEPRIFAEVKHRRQTSMGSNEVRSFMGGRQPGDRCLFVSTGGFTKEARYEAERSNVPLTLVDLPKLRELLVEHYEAVDLDTKRMIPLVATYWPASGSSWQT